MTFVDLTYPVERARLAGDIRRAIERERDLAAYARAMGPDTIRNSPSCTVLSRDKRGAMLEWTTRWGWIEAWPSPSQRSETGEET
jgi:hypothetical protein